MKNDICNRFNDDTTSSQSSEPPFPKTSNPLYEDASKSPRRNATAATAAVREYPFTHPALSSNRTSADGDDSSDGYSDVSSNRGGRVWSSHNRQASSHNVLSLSQAGLPRGSGHSLGSGSYTPFGLSPVEENTIDTSTTSDTSVISCRQPPSTVSSADARHSGLSAAGLFAEEEEVEELTRPVAPMALDAGTSAREDFGGDDDSGFRAGVLRPLVPLIASHSPHSAAMSSFGTSRSNSFASPTFDSNVSESVFASVGPVGDSRNRGASAGIMTSSDDFPEVRIASV